MNGLRVVHESPGRLRLRVPVGVEVTGLVDAVAGEAGVTSCMWSPRTRSILVLYQPGSASPAAIASSVARQTGLDAPADLHGSPWRPTPSGTPGSGLARGVTEAFSDLDQRVQHLTRGVIGLAGIVPVALTVWALAEIVRGRAAPLAWSSALWYAHGLFRDYSAPGPQD